MDEMSNLQKLAEEECYLDMVKLLHHIVHLLIKQYGLGYAMAEGWQELSSIANELFIQAHRSHDPGKGDYRKRVRYVVWNGLLDHLRKLAWRNRLCKQHNVDFVQHDKGLGRLGFGDQAELGQGVFLKGKTALKLEKAIYRDWRNEMFLVQMLDSLSDDAKGVIRLVLDPPQEPKRAKSPTQWRSRLTRMLREMGWGASRIAEAFSEIGRAIG